MDNRNSVLAKVYRKIISTIINLISKENNYDIANTTLIIGSTRSGTTYLMENINSDNDYKLIFEPFNNTYVGEWSDFETRHYIDPTSPTVAEKQSVQKILSGKIKNKWTDQFNRKIRSNKRLIKAVRANFLIEYIRKEYPELSIIYLVRDPYDVVASRINMNFDPRDLKGILSFEELFKHHYSDVDITDIYKVTPSNEAKHAALWCLENRFLLLNEAKLGLKRLNYEDIKGMSVQIKDSEIVLTQKQSKPSASSALGSPYILTQEEKDNIKRVLDLFEIERYSY